MGWIGEVATSQFVWGIIVGLLLAIVVAAVTVWLDSQRRRRLVAAFCQDLVGSVCDQIQNLEDNRDRNRVIHHEFLNTIDAEIIVYGRNREHLVQVSDEQLRKDVREFFTRVAGQIAQVRWRLAQFQEQFDIAKTPTALPVPDPRLEQAQAMANQHLAEAHKACDRLRELAARRDQLTSRLEKVARRWL